MVNRVTIAANLAPHIAIHGPFRQEIGYNAGFRI